MLDALGDTRAPAAYAAAARVVDGSEAHDLRAMQALAEIKQGDPPPRCAPWTGWRRTSVPGRLAQALAYSGAAVMGFAAPELGTAKAAECRRLALESGDRTALVIASWAQAAAAHARDDLRQSLWADLLDTHALRELAVSVFDGHLCMTQRLLYGARPYPDVVAFAEAFRAEAERLGAGRGSGLRHDAARRGQAPVRRPGRGRRRPAGGGPAQPGRRGRHRRGAGAAAARRGGAAPRADRDGARQLLDEALAVARESNVGFHLLDRIYGARIAAAADPRDRAGPARRGRARMCAARWRPAPAAGSRSPRPPPSPPPAAATWTARARYARDTETLATVVMRLPGWDAALDEVTGHLAAARGDPDEAASLLPGGGLRFDRAASPWTRARCRATGADPARNVRGTPA